VQDTDSILAEIDEVFARCGASPTSPVTPKHDVYARAERSGREANEPPILSNTAMVTAIVAAIERNAPLPSYIEAARAISITSHGGLASTPATVDMLLGVLQSIRRDIEAGYVRDLEARVRHVLSGDLLETAEAIMGARFHPAPAIVLAVSVLEEHVRKLAEARNIDILKANGKHRSFEDMITDLEKAGAINSSEKRTMHGWYHQRTEAAHGRFDGIVPDETPRIIGSVRDFIFRHPQ
jgi:hypothetical protein